MVSGLSLERCPRCGLFMWLNKAVGVCFHCWKAEIDEMCSDRGDE